MPQNSMRLAACMALALAIAATASAQEPSRLLLSASGAVQTNTAGFQDNVRFLLNAENGDFNADYRVGTGRVFDAGAGLRVWRNLIAGIDVSYFDKQGRVSVDARLPHPFFFDRPRAVSGAADALRRTEIGVHVQAGWLVALGERLDLVLSAGPSYIRLRQPLVDQVAFTETFPFNSASFAGVSTTMSEKGRLGVNVGGDLTLRFHRHFGLGTRLRFSRASLEIASVDGDDVEVDAGGLQIVAGLRARF